MSSIIIREIKDDIMYADAKIGHDIVKEIIPEAVGVFGLLGYGLDKMVLRELNNISIEITKDTTIEDAVEQWVKIDCEKKYPEVLQTQAWLKTPAGQKYLETLKGEPGDSIFYSNVDEALLALSEITPSDLTSDKTSQEDAVRLCKEVLTVVLKSGKLSFNDTQIKQFKDSIKALGCSRYEEVNKKFKSGEDDLTVRELRKTKGNIVFPLLKFSRLLDGKDCNFSDDISEMARGGIERSLIGTWLVAQEKPVEKTAGIGKN